MFKYGLILTACFLLTGSLTGQSDKLGYGFRAGASVSKLDGPSETGPNGEALESYSSATGFHIGAAVSYKMTDLVGMRAEFVFSQRGTLYDYEGPSYYVLGRGNVLTTTIDGTRKQTSNLSNAYLDIPVMIYYKFGGFEISGGLNSALLLASTGGGSTDFNGLSSLGNAIAPFEVGLIHNYKRDKAGGASATTQNVVVDGRSYTIPETVGAYYEFSTKDKALYNTLDFGLVACASYFLNEGLFLSARYVHGMGDVDRNQYDVSLQALNPDGSFIQRADKNTSRSWQFSVGFSF